MTQELRFPFQLNTAFFSTIRFHRAEVVPDDLPLQFKVGVSTFDRKLPESLQIALRLETQDELPVAIYLELIGLFGLIEGHSEPNRETITDFLNERALFMLWPYLTQTIRQITAMMGIEPIEIKIPVNYDLKAQRKDK